MHIEHCASAFSAFGLLNWVYNLYVCNGFFENSFEERVEQEQKQVLALLIGKGFFESEVKRERSEPTLQRRLAFANNGLFKHNTSFMAKVKQEPKFNVKKEGCEALRNEDGNIEKFAERLEKCSA
jgi:hypothetical protein